MKQDCRKNLIILIQDLSFEPGERRYEYIIFLGDGMHPPLNMYRFIYPNFSIYYLVTSLGIRI